jgi:anaerobic magnesium-protoporphyrin IX monomethyl ester cyclase
MMKKDLVLINPPSAFSAYIGTRINAVFQNYPILGLASLAAVARKNNFDVSILDLGIELDPYKYLEEKLKEMDPSFIGVTSTTPLFPEVSELSRFLRKIMGKKAVLVVGGPHPSALPEDCLKESEFDVVIYGEGEMSLLELLQRKPHKDIKGIYYRDGDKIVSTGIRPMITDLDSLPFPAIDLFDIKRYKCPRVLNRKSPMINFMTSRGCVYECTFCSKNIFGRRFRAKSVDYVLGEIEYCLNQGIQELRFVDDEFTTNMDRAKSVCEGIIRKGLKFPWNLAAGLRVDRVDEEFFKIAKRAGLYQVAFGFESGDQACLDSIKKGILVEQSYKAMSIVKKVKGIETVGFFMFGLPAETEESMKKTMDFALKLMPDMAKVTITIPFPGTEMYKDYENRGLIKSRDWTLYNLHRAGDIYEHPTVSHKLLEEYYDLFYRKFYLNPRYLLNRLVKGIFSGTLIEDIKTGLATFFPKFFKPKMPG